MWLIPTMLFALFTLPNSNTATKQHPLAVESPWDLNKPLTENTTANLIFATCASLLQSTPNLRYRNGHTIVPGIIPTGSLVYHGRGDSIIPDMDWVAFEPEVSHGFCRQFGSSTNCWLLTFAVTRPLRVLYFDGAGASKVEDGAMDTQDLFSWGSIMPELVREDALRIQKMCEWGKTLGLDGFVRTGGFAEIMLCNFSSMTVVSSQHLKSTPIQNISPTPTFQIPPNSVPINSDFIDHFIGLTERFSAYPGLTHVHLDLTHLVSFYDHQLVPSLVAVRSGKPRLEHRLLGITEEDILQVKRHVTEQILETSWSPLEDVGDLVRVDWRTRIHSIVDMYGKALEDIWDIVNSTAVRRQSADTQRVKDAFRLIEALVQRFVLFTVSPHQDPYSRENKSDIAWASSVFKECALSHTNPDVPTTARTSLPTKSEQLLIDAVKKTTHELCRVLTKMWAEGVNEGLSGLFNGGAPPHSELESNRAALLGTWKDDIRNLMAWLDWGAWVTCKPACRELELCYLPTWPFSVGNVPQPVWHADDPQPRCLRKLAPFIYADEYHS